MEEIKTQLIEKNILPDAIVDCNKIVSKNTKKSYFVKIGTGGNSAEVNLLEYEALCLTKLNQACTESKSGIVVPKPLYTGALKNKEGFIVMDELKFGRAPKDFEARFGKGLALMHKWRDPHQKIFGFPLEGCCGALEQSNNKEQRNINWVEFWAEYRLGFQLETLKKRYPSDYETYEKGQQVLKKLPDLFSMIHVEDIQPSLIHGDLWSGNRNIDQDGNPVIYDPAAYYGHCEAEWGIMNMFGKPGSSFVEAYHKEIPKEKGFEKRVLLYELHHHLNHYNIFGWGYQGGALSLMKRILKD